MYHLNAWENAGEYFAAVAETDLMNYELVASEDFLIRCMVANPPPSLMICKNCLLPVFPMVHLPLQTFEQYAIAVGVDTANLVPTVTIDLKSDTKLLQRLCDQTLCLIILWLKENECDYTSDTFGEVFLREPQVWLNVLHFLRIGVKLVEIFTVDILGISKSYLEEFKKKKNKKLSFKALLNLATFNQIGIEKFTEDSNIVPNRDLS